MMELGCPDVISELMSWEGKGRRQTSGTVDPGEWLEVGGCLQISRPGELISTGIRRCSGKSGTWENTGRGGTLASDQDQFQFVAVTNTRG